MRWCRRKLQSSLRGRPRTSPSRTRPRSCGQPRRPLRKRRGWGVDAAVLAAAAGRTYLYFGGGLDAAGSGAGTVDVARVAAGGQLDAFADASRDFAATRAGYGVAAANGSLFAFGGVSSEGGNPLGNATAAKFVDATTLTPNSWNNEGLTMDPARYLMGSAIESAFIFFLGGQTLSLGGAAEEASASTSFVVWQRMDGVVDRGDAVRPLPASLDLC